MTGHKNKSGDFNVVIVAQEGRLAYEALLFAASLRHNSPKFSGRLLVAEPRPEAKWAGRNTLIPDSIREGLEQLGAEIIPFTCNQFGADYPYGNKIEALLALPENEPFLFFDTDTLITGELTDIPFDFSKPSASMKREDTWPKLELYGPGYTETWKSLYDKFGLDFESSLDLAHPNEFWERYLYFNAGWFFHSCPRTFGELFLNYALQIRDNAPKELVCQPLDPWLDQIALPLVIHTLGGGRHTIPNGLLDDSHSCHYRLMPLFYARENDRSVDLLEEVAAPNKIKKLLKQYDPFKRMIYQRRGRKARALFDQNNLPKREAAIRNTLKRNGFWMR